MPDADCETGNCQLAAESVWFLVVMVVVWTVVVVLAVAWVLACQHSRRNTDHSAYQSERSPQLKSALTVGEIQRRLEAEAAEPPPPVRNITVVDRPMSPMSPIPSTPLSEEELCETDTDPRTEPLV